MKVGGLFEGYGGLTMGVQSVIGGELAWYSEIDPDASQVLAYHHPGVPNLGDITTVDWSTVERVDVLTGGFPCQDVSAAGKRAGMAPGTRSGLWSHMAYAVSQLRPRLVVVENVRGLLSAKAHSDVQPCPGCVGDGETVVMRALGAVLADLAGLGYDARWRGVRASDVGAPHQRSRIFIVATDTRAGRRDGWANSSTRQQSPHPAGHHQTIADTMRQPARGPGGEWPPIRERSTGRRETATDAVFVGRDTRRPVGERPPIRERSAGRREPATDAASGGVVTDWGKYALAIEQWAGIIGRPPPVPAIPGRRGGPVLNPALVEWLMGLPEGHVTGINGLSRATMLKILGNGVVPQQAAAALTLLLPSPDSVDVETAPDPTDTGGNALAVKLAGALPLSDKNGIDAISASLVDNPETGHLIVALVDCSRVTTNNDTGDVVPTMRIRAIEGHRVDTPDGEHLRRALAQAYEQRTGKVELPL